MMHVQPRSFSRFVRALFRPTAPILLVVCVVLTAVSLIVQPFSAVMLSLCLISLAGTIGSITYNIQHGLEQEDAPVQRRNSR